MLLQDDECTVEEVINDCVDAATRLVDEELSTFQVLTPPSTDQEMTFGPGDDSSEVTSVASVKEEGPKSLVCKWRNCDWPGLHEDLVDHIKEIHVDLQPYYDRKDSMTAFTAIWAPDEENTKKNTRSSGSSASTTSSTPQQQYVCLWEGCKVNGKGSLSRNWLERHVLEHSGPRPYKCIVEGCGARFKARSALEKHVNAHFNGPLMDMVSSLYGDGPGNETWDGPMMMRVKGEANGGNNSISSSGTPNKLLKKKKIAKMKRRSVNVKGNQDYFDAHVMEHVRYSLYQMDSVTGVNLAVSSQRDVTFHGQVIARRIEKSGMTTVLLHYAPENILPDEWVSEAKVEESSTKSIAINSLPYEALAKLMEITTVRRPGRKQKRK